MAKEIELKIIEIDIPTIVAKLKALGGTTEGRKLIKDIKFDFPDNRIKEKDDLFRLRQLGEKTFLTYKYYLDKSEMLIAEEIEVEVADKDGVEKIVNLLGFKEVARREKWRTTYRFENVIVEIDEFDTIPPFLEIEGEPDAIREMVEKLGYTMDDTSAFGNTKLLKKYGADPYNQTVKK